MDAGSFLSENRGLEQSLRCTETKELSAGAKEKGKKKGCLPLVTDSDDLAIRKFVTLFKARGLRGGLNFLFKVEGNIT
jgi:hypothetical protein